MTSPRIWYLFIEGRFTDEVAPWPDIEGFFTNCLVFAGSKREAIDYARKGFQREGMSLVSVEEIGELTEFSFENPDFEQRIKELASELDTPGDVEYTDFHCWPKGVTEGGKGKMAY
ncbi:MAG TPA: hypothetical protein VE439_01740 [Anaerolineae bacterium]|jgi:hypothetical protein|nr:hypothetical protein [Anaerolineae bacterium]